MSEKIERLKAILSEVDDLRRTIELLWWDRETKMPNGGAAARADQLATLTRIHHNTFTSAEVGTLLDDLSSDAGSLDPDSDEACMIKVVKRDYDNEVKLPADLVEEVARASAEGMTAWHEARSASDYSRFVPALRRNTDLSRRIVDALGYKERPYDALIELYEPGMTTAQLETIFADLKAAIVPLVREISSRQDRVDDTCLHRNYDKDTQLSVALDVVRRFGYDTERGRMDESAHPFCTSFGSGDVRITTRVEPHFLNACLFATMHESGHAMYEQGVSPTLKGTLLQSGATAGVHESQSRLWENLIGRSRPYQDYLLPRLQQAFPEQLGDIDKETFYRAINRVHPSLIRVEADEVTYNLHILLRFEIENELLEGRLAVDNLNEVWNDRMEEYIGIRPDSDANGVLQDMHLSSAGTWAFPSYTLGNIIGAQLYAQVRKEIPNLDESISRGDFGELLGWLQEKVYRHGRKYTANELLQRTTGNPVGTGAWISYVRRKFSDIYGLA